MLGPRLVSTLARRCCGGCGVSVSAAVTRSSLGGGIHRETLQAPWASQGIQRAQLHTPSARQPDDAHHDDTVAPSPGAAAAGATAAPAPLDAESHAVFRSVWEALESTHGDELSFPREIVFLSGAPAAGKGTNIELLMAERELPSKLEVSSLFSSPAFAATKAAGRLISDADVVATVLGALANPALGAGVVVDGFPRTRTQAAAVVLLAERLQERCTRFARHPSPALRARTQRPRFTLAVLWVSEDESVRRQLGRGDALARANKIAEEVGLESLAGGPLRATDLDAERARLRYALFREEVAACLAVARGHVREVFIDASGAPADVAARIRAEFAYSSSLDLEGEVYEELRTLESASALVAQARSRLVRRLATYARETPALLRDVVALLQRDFFHILSRQALAGAAVVRSVAPLLEKPGALDVALDVLAERGFTVVLDVQRREVPTHVIAGDATEGLPQRIVCSTERTFVFRIAWPKPAVHHSSSRGGAGKH